MMESGLAARFQKLTRDDLDLYLEDRQEENLHLDFKTLAGPQLRAADDRRNFAKALSGFANSDGGMIVWGVDARKNDNGVDCALSLKPIAEVASLVSRLSGLTSDMVSPSVDGILHRVVYQEADASGFAATLVPYSETGPHMAKAALDRYYKRSGDSFVKMEHFDLADMFGRRARPSLALFHTITTAGTKAVEGRPVVILRVVLGIENLGRGTARAPYLAVKAVQPLKVSRFGVDGNCREGLPRLASRDPSYVKYGGMADTVIHPNTSREVLMLTGDYDCSASPAINLSVLYELTAEGVELMRGELLIQSDEIMEIQGIPGASPGSERNS